ncbi:MAG: glycosyltransferase family 2 protein, partial [Patescibacteria group bacterium]
MLIAVIPAFNEAKRIAQVVADARKVTDAVVVVDDGSDDGTAEAAEAGGARVLRHHQNCGAGAATMTGIEAARRLGADAVVTLDADGQHDPRDIPSLLRPIRDGTADIVFSNRFGPFLIMQGKRRNRIPFIRRLFNAIGNVLTLLAAGKWVSDSQSGFKVLGKRALEEIDLRMSEEQLRGQGLLT